MKKTTRRGAVQQGNEQVVTRWIFVLCGTLSCGMARMHTRTKHIAPKGTDHGFLLATRHIAPWVYATMKRPSSRWRTMCLSRGAWLAVHIEKYILTKRCATREILIHRVLTRSSCTCSGEIYLEPVNRAPATRELIAWVSRKLQESSRKKYLRLHPVCFASPVCLHPIKPSYARDGWTSPTSSVLRWYHCCKYGREWVPFFKKTMWRLQFIDNYWRHAAHDSLDMELWLWIKGQP